MVCKDLSVSSIVSVDRICCYLYSACSNGDASPVYGCSSQICFGWTLTRTCTLPGTRNMDTSDLTVELGRRRKTRLTLCNFLLVSSILLCNSSRFFVTSASPLACFVAFTTAWLRTLLLLVLSAPVPPPLSLAKNADSCGLRWKEKLNGSFRQRRLPSVKL